MTTFTAEIVMAKRPWFKARFGTASERRIAAKAFLQEFEGRASLLVVYAAGVLRCMIDTL